jgi:hypothetical protein
MGEARDEPPRCDVLGHSAGDYGSGKPGECTKPVGQGTRAGVRRPGLGVRFDVNDLVAAVEVDGSRC